MNLSQNTMIESCSTNLKKIRKVFFIMIELHFVFENWLPKQTLKIKFWWFFYAKCPHYWQISTIYFRQSIHVCIKVRVKVYSWKLHDRNLVTLTDTIVSIFYRKLVRLRSNCLQVVHCQSDWFFHQLHNPKYNKGFFPDYKILWTQIVQNPEVQIFFFWFFFWIFFGLKIP